MAEADSIRYCAHCGGSMAGVGIRASYCGNRCKWAAKEQRRGPRKWGTKRPTRQAACATCGTLFQSTASGGNGGWTRHCSRRCGQAHRRVDLESRRALRSECAALRRIANRRERQWRTERGCTTCGTPVVGLLNWRRTCAECKAAAHRKRVRIEKAARKARIRGRRRDPIDPIAVFERDGWRCYLCGIATPKEMRGTHEPSAPELEHKLAIANGGTHTWDNVACACRACNQAKGAKLKA